MNHMKLSEDLKALANRFKALYDLSDAFQKLGSLEQAEKELLAKADKAKSLAEKAADEQAAQERALDAAKVAVTLEYRKAEESKESAQKRAAQIICDSEAKADQIVKQAEAKAAVYQEKIAGLKAELFVASAELEGKREELAKLKSEFDSARARFAAFMKA